MRNITFDLSTLHEHGSAFFDYLELRKKFFVDRLGWDIPHNDRFEMDQYDNPTAWYSLAIDNGEVIGGARVMSAKSIWGKHTYMMGDAATGKLGAIPSSVIPANSNAEVVWEMTRLVVADRLTHAADRKACLQLVCDGCIDIVQSHGCQELIALSSIPMIRVLRQAGYPVDRFGGSWRDSIDGRTYSPMKMDIAPALQVIAAE